jgi:type I restriction enzyme S subunit
VILNNTELPFPPLPEQRAIAEVLSDVDALITALDRLIAKKRAIKKGAMQDLLTGKTRLPGFSGPWRAYSIGNDSTLNARIGWHGLTTDEYLANGDYYLVTGTDFAGGMIDWNSCHFVDKERYDQDEKIQLEPGDVLITKDGTIGKVAYVDHLPGEATLNSGVFVIRPKDGVYDSRYLYHVLSSSIFQVFLKQLQAGSTISHLYQKDFVNFEFLAPSRREQKAIATVLSDMDAEIIALEARHDKIRTIKQGMMQQLLTGRIRLVGASS